ncbi:glycosyltransferase family 2 protein [Pedobacter sp. SAFR-022]|uniref:glycosyltransferase family 2 protein n=1 Tax=Pedobacter sp. SAFR-022 TaxID=3436861 RepID=UPI003F7E583B
MPEQPLVSIIIPVYNRADRVAATLDSLIAQTYTHFEIILVDDGSTDRSAEVIAPYLNTRIKYYKQQNAGAPAARNYGFSLANGELIVFFDSDDLMLPSRLEEQVKAMVSQQAQACAAGFYVNMIGGQQYLPVLPGKEPIMDLFIKRKVLGSTQSWMFSKAMVAAVNGFDLSLSCRQDIDLTFRILQQNPTVALLPKPLSLFIDHEGGERIMNNWNSLKHLGSKERYHHKVLNYLATQNRGDLLPKALDYYYWDVLPAYVKRKEYGKAATLYSAALKYSKALNVGSRLKVLAEASKSLMHWFASGLKN